MALARAVRESLRRALLPSAEISSTTFAATAGSRANAASSRQPYPLATQLISLRGFAAAGPGRAPAAHEASRRRAAEQGRYLVALVVGMVGLTYASVPLYRLFCQATGFGGTVQEGRSVEEKLRRRQHSQDADLEAAAAARELTITFNADVSDGLEWRFTPTQRSVKVRPGQSALAFYTAHNLSAAAVTGVSTYNVAPQQAGQYFNKVQCFCFEEQRLRAGERVDMPVFFYIDPEFATDPRMDGINSITLSYTFFKVAEDEAEAAAEEHHAAPAAVAAPGQVALAGH